MKLYKGDEYRANNAWPYAIAAGCVVYRVDGGKIEVLLLKRNPGHQNDPERADATYNLPKGHLKMNDTLEATALRETKEEAGVEVEIETYLGATTHEFTHPRYSEYNVKTTHYFAAKYSHDLGDKDDEHDEVLWCDLNQATIHLAKPDARRDEAKFIDRLKDYLELTDES